MRSESTFGKVSVPTTWMPNVASRPSGVWRHSTRSFASYSLRRVRDALLPHTCCLTQESAVIQEVDTHLKSINAAEPTWSTDLRRSLLSVYRLLGATPVTLMRTIHDELEAARLFLASSDESHLRLVVSRYYLRRAHSYTYNRSIDRVGSCVMDHHS